MHRQKWQGIYCLLLASLMMSTSFGATARGAAPTTPTQTAAPTQSPAPTTGTQTQAPAQTPAPTPTQIITPAPKTTQAPQNQTGGSSTSTTQKTPQAVTPKATQAPQTTAPCAPKASEKTPATPSATQAPTTQAPAHQTPSTSIKPAAPCKPLPKATPEQNNKQQQKPFVLDHFKMIVNTLKQLGVEESEITNYIKEGKKLEEILKAEKISPKKFKKCMYKQYCEVIDAAVKEGKITAEQAKQLKTAIKETIHNWLPKK